MGERSRRRAWQLFPGKNRFCCNGRCIMARSLGIFYLTLGLIVGTTILFFAFECRLLWTRFPLGLGPLITVGAVCISTFVLGTLLRCSFTDPGIIPRSTPDEAAWLDAEFEALSQQTNNAGTYRPPARMKEVVVNGRSLKLKYCYTCKLWRPPRASHCSTCDNCVDRFDHHCPWVGNCVGVRNYRYFYLFISSLSIYCVYIMTFAILNLYFLSKDKSFLEAMKQSPVSIIEILIAFISVWSVVGLAGFHTMLICRDISTNEDIKGIFNTNRNPDLFNPFARNNHCANCCALLCGPPFPSLLDLRAWVEVDSEGRVIPAAGGGSTAQGGYDNNSAQILLNGGGGSGIGYDSRQPSGISVHYGATGSSPSRHATTQEPRPYPTQHNPPVVPAGPIVPENRAPVFQASRHHR